MRDRVHAGDLFLAILVLIGLMLLYYTLPPVRADDLPVIPHGGRDALPRVPDLTQETNDVPAPIFFGESISLAGDSIVYVVDRSGSMLKEDRIHEAKRQLLQSLQGLSSALRFNVLLFDCSVTAFAEKPMAASAESKAAAAAWINSHYLVGGGTASAPAVVSGLDQGPAAVVFLTDGAPGGCGLGGAELHRRLIRQGNPELTPIHVFAINAEGDYRAFCHGVASDSGGSLYDIR